MNYIADYDLGERIGKGGMASVYRGRHGLQKQLVAIKIPREEFCEDPQFVRRFLREGRLCAQLNHPAIVRVFDTGQDNAGRPYIVMELLQGETLSARLRRGPLPVRQALVIIQEVLSALQAAHDLGIVHRDIKPGNIFLTSDGGVKLMDFGIARAMGESRLTMIGSQMGTPEYMSPEQIEDSPLDGRADLYSVGLVLHEMLTGDAPFQADTPFAVMRMQLSYPAPPLPPHIPEPVQMAVTKALEKEPRRRFSSAAEMYYALDPKVIVPRGFAVEDVSVAQPTVLLTPSSLPPHRRPTLRVTTRTAARTTALMALVIMFAFLSIIVHGITANASKSDSVEIAESGGANAHAQQVLPSRPERNR
jgi:serine/threonine-protein kinase